MTRPRPSSSLIRGTLHSGRISVFDDWNISNAPGLPERFRACLKIRKGAVVAPQAGWRGATKENIPRGSSTEEQRSQPACGAKTLRAAGLLTVACVGSALTARCGDARTSPPCPQPKSLAAAPFPIFQTGSYGLRRQSEAATALLGGPAAAKCFHAPAIKSGVAASLCHRGPHGNPSLTFEMTDVPMVLAR
jgi:hypothetical protein